MINWGIVGLGNMANKFASSIRDVNNVRLHGISSLDKKKLEIFKKDFNIQNEYAFNNYDKNLSFGYINSELSNKQLTDNNLYIEIEKKKYLAELLTKPLKLNKFKNI